jgi:hypothetical protein
MRAECVNRVGGAGFFVIRPLMRAIKWHSFPLGGVDLTSASLPAQTNRFGALFSREKQAQAHSQEFLIKCAGNASISLTFDAPNK